VLNFTVLENRGVNASEVQFGGTSQDPRVTITLTLSDVLGAGETLTLLQNGSPNRTLNSGATLSFNDRLDSGDYSYSARIADSAGNVAALDLNGALPGQDFAFRIA
jgi:hypothetical protein